MNEFYSTLGYNTPITDSLKKYIIQGTPKINTLITLEDIIVDDRISRKCFNISRRYSK